MEDLVKIIINLLKNMEQEPRTHKFLTSLPFWWIVLTAVYVVLQLLDFYLGRSRYAQVIGLLGLFVPIGMWNFGVSLEISSLLYHLLGILIPPGIITFPLVLLTVFGGNRLIRKLNLSPILKFAIILCVLFALTIAVDFILWGRWQSMKFVTGNALDFLRF